MHDRTRVHTRSLIAILSVLQKARRPRKRQLGMTADQQRFARPRAANSPAITAPAPDCSARERYFSSSTNTRSCCRSRPDARHPAHLDTPIPLQAGSNCLSNLLQ